MNLQEQLVRATQIAIEAHTEHLDKNGQPYLGHVLRVMSAGHTLQEKITGALHDVIEDSDWTLEDLAKEGFSQDILSAVDTMTHCDDSETYDEYLLRIVKNPIAVRVKLNDLSDNMDIRRLKELDETTISRLRKYLKAYKFLTEFHSTLQP
ncbi:MAG: phosphohydrolase [Petrimonas sp.]|jgi:(p)ppGpp synthase/HD superfamily hydrolase|nr:MAG: GTP pyrophosphokinase [Bacteroidetes bacterium ADurb.BinA174]